MIDSNDSIWFVSDNLSTFNIVCEVVLCSNTHPLTCTYTHTHTHRPLSHNHIISRLKKHLGDLYLLTGQLQQASAQYRSALPSLSSLKDWLWAGSVQEALSVTAIITKECEEVLGQKAHGTAIGGTSNIFRKVCSYWGGALNSGVEDYNNMIITCFMVFMCTRMPVWAPYVILCIIYP